VNLEDSGLVGCHILVCCLPTCRRNVCLNLSGSSGPVVRNVGRHLPKDIVSSQKARVPVMVAAFSQVPRCNVCFLEHYCNTT